jgi:phospholipid transport system substrate-binding protein
MHWHKNVNASAFCNPDSLYLAAHFSYRRDSVDLDLGLAISVGAQPGIGPKAVGASLRRGMNMPLASIGRRRCLQIALAFSGTALGLRHAQAEPAAVAPIRELCDALLRIMRAGSGTPFAQRFNALAPVVERVFNLPAILQVSVGPAWSSLPPDQQSSLLAAFRRYTVASYVNSFDNFNGQRFDIQPNTKDLPNGEQLAQTRIVSSSDSHELDYVMRREDGTWKAVDVLADGSISRAAVQRSDFRRLVARGGAQALIDSLERKTADLSSGAALPG